MFLAKPERYDVTVKVETGELFQLGETGQVARDRRVLENVAFGTEKNRFYRTEVTESEPVKGNFTSVARCRLSGILLGPTNYHGYQVQLRNLYEQRFSRRMSFPDYQRQIEIINDPEAVEKWKEEARTVTTYISIEDEPQTFSKASEAERHFRQRFLPALLHARNELTIDGVISRHLCDKSLGRQIEDAWAQEFRSPARMMQELSGAFRQNALHIFRHRKGMLFVSPIRPRPFSHATSSVSASVAGIVAALTETPGMNRKQLLEKLQPAESEEGREKMKRTLASDLHWLISEGHVIEFNDGALDLPRTKVVPPESEQLSNGAARTVTPDQEPLSAITHVSQPEAAPAQDSSSSGTEPVTHSAVTPPPESAGAN